MDFGRFEAGEVLVDLCKLCFGTSDRPMNFRVAAVPEISDSLVADIGSILSRVSDVVCLATPSSGDASDLELMVIWPELEEVRRKYALPSATKFCIAVAKDSKLAMCAVSQETGTLLSSAEKYMKRDVLISTEAATEILSHIIKVTPSPHASPTFD